MKLPYWHVDAFADRPFAGNQAAVMPLDEWLPDDVLQAIGEENNFAETAFVVRDATGESGLGAALVHPDRRDPPVRPRHARQRACAAASGTAASG